MSRKSMQDTAFDILKSKKKPVPFQKLWEDVSLVLGLSGVEASSRIVKFYNAVSLDARFYQLEGNTWDLSSRHSFEKIRDDKKRYDDIDFDEESDDDDISLIDDDEVESKNSNDDDDDDM